MLSEDIFLVIPSLHSLAREGLGCAETWKSQAMIRCISLVPGITSLLTSIGSTGDSPFSTATTSDFC